MLIYSISVSLTALNCCNLVSSGISFSSSSMIRSLLIIFSLVWIIIGSSFLEITIGCISTFETDISFGLTIIIGSLFGLEIIIGYATVFSILWV
jgi:hypothetical protein